ncbi:MAG: 4Fe-4S binding protein [Treponema sp.]|jgi:ferredoxin|nr:4Fe-4S binding protein [Treponema sp.]
MVRKIIKINKDKCNGCGLCVSACHEGAIGLKDGKAELLRDDYCDGLGNCLPVCPTGAISFEERDAAEYNEEKVKIHQQEKNVHRPPAGGCPGSNAHMLKQNQENVPVTAPAGIVNQLQQWPVQIKLVPVNAPYFENANLLVAADCAAYAYANFHNDFMKNKITLIGCPKLDNVDYSEKIGAIISANNIKSVTVVRMEVPCCGGIENAVVTALKNSGKMIQWRVVTFSTNGEIIDG